MSMVGETKRKERVSVSILQGGGWIRLSNHVFEVLPDADYLLFSDSQSDAIIFTFAKNFFRVGECLYFIA
ncbi:MAG: hypothetical protein FWF86_02260 [Clostridia bacterium]|nr:hypothetical protein [Clostridia bacterium]